MLADELRPFPRAVLLMLQTALPFQHRPAVEIVAGEFREDGAKVDLAVAEAAEAPRPAQPILIAAVDAGASGGIELGVLHVKHLDALVVDVDERQIVELLQDEVARVVEDVGARMALHFLQEALESHAVVQILAWVDLVAAVHAVLLEDVENRPPAGGEFLKAGVHEAGRALRPRVHHRPQQRTGKRNVRIEAQVAARLGRELHLFDRPCRALGWLAVQMRRREAVEELVVGGMDGHQLAFEVGGELGDLHAARAHPAGQFVAVVLALGGLGDIDEGRIADRHLDADEAEIRRPPSHGLDVVERILVGHELGEKNRRALERLHACFLR